TDSTCNGWKAKSAATSALGQSRPVITSSDQKSRMALAACSSVLVKWKPAASPGECSCRLAIPQSWASSCSESQVNGCQFATSKLVNAQLISLEVSPARTWGLA